MIAITDNQRLDFTRSGSLTQRQGLDLSLEQAVRRRIATCPYSFVFDKITWQLDEGTLTLRGSVPSFYLKQMLQELLRDVDQVDRIANEVNVVSSTGLSSDRPTEPR